MSDIDLKDPAYYFNRELSYLQFNQRVLALACDAAIPMLERLQFLLISNRNLDEFFEIRVGQLKEKLAFGHNAQYLNGMNAQDTLKAISELAHTLVQSQYEALNDILIPALETVNVRFLKREVWSEAQANWAEDFFERQVLPIVTPIGLDLAHPFPRLINKNLNFIISLEGDDAFKRTSGLAIVHAPRSLPRFVRIPDEICLPGDNFVFLSSIIHAHADKLFPGMKVTGCYQFRLTRNSDFSIDEDNIDSLPKALQGQLHSRNFGRAVRLEAADNCPDNLLKVLQKECHLDEDACYLVKGPVNMNRLLPLAAQLDRPDLKYPDFTPKLPGKLSSNADLFKTIDKEDILLYHPFESFTPVLNLIHQAATDDKVLAIKQTLYRTGHDSPIVQSLIEAARQGKEVTAVVELRARFDEAENIKLANELQKAGVLVVYGILGYKTHAKMSLIVRRQNGRMKRYVHLGTGNYHAENAKRYTDYSLMTCQKDICQDVHLLFQQLTGMGQAHRLKRLLQSPFSLKKQLLQLIKREAQHAQSGKKAHIIAKMNAITDQDMIEALYQASQAGVKIDLIVRSICVLRPGVKGVSDNIRVRTVLGRFLEHSRIYYFLNDEAPQVFCASADWMERNLKHRVEVAYPILEGKLADKLKKDGLMPYLRSTRYTWQLDSTGQYHPVTTKTGEPRCAQTLLLERFR